MDNNPHTYTLEVEGDYPFEIRKYKPVLVEPGETYSIPLRIVVPKNEFDASKAELLVSIQAQDNDKIRATEKSSFIGPGK